MWSMPIPNSSIFHILNTLFTQTCTLLTGSITINYYLAASKPYLLSAPNVLALSASTILNVDSFGIKKKLEILHRFPDPANIHISKPTLNVRHLSLLD